MTAAVRCKVTACKYNGGTFCNKPVVIINNGACNEHVDKSGPWRNPEEWQRTSAPEDKDVEQT